MAYKYGQRFYAKILKAPNAPNRVNLGFTFLYAFFYIIKCLGESEIDMKFSSHHRTQKIENLLTVFIELTFSNRRMLLKPHQKLYM